MKSKLFFILFALCTLVLMLFGMTSCGHQHVFAEWETLSEPSCAADGLKERRCECGYCEYAPITALAHTPAEDPAVEATCSSEGKSAGSHCAVCYATITPQTAIEKKPHVFSEWETLSEASCAAAGLRFRICECGYHDYATVPAPAHTPVADPAVEATCSSEGKSAGSHCAVCHRVIQEQTTIARTPHRFSAWQTEVEASCVSFGFQVRTCACSQIEYKFLPALSHSPVTDPAVAATCTATGKTEGSHCGTCSAILVPQAIVPATGHQCDRIEIVTEALANQDGTKRFYCSHSGCDYYYDESYSLEALSTGEILAEASKYTGILKTFSFLGGEQSMVSAIVISSDGKILAPYIALDNAYGATFQLGEVIYDVNEILAYSEKTGLAVLKIEAEDLTAAPLKAGGVDGESIYTVGAPGGLANSISAGIVSNANRMLNQTRYIQHDAHGIGGYLGGPLINRFGEVIGINAGYFKDQNNNYAVAIEEMEKLVYGEPLTMREFGEMTTSPAEQLIYWVSLNLNYSTSSYHSYQLVNTSHIYSLGYRIEDETPFIKGVWVLDANTSLQVVIFLNDNDGVYEYVAVLDNGTYRNEVNGLIVANGFDGSQTLTYDTFHGKYWDEDLVMPLYTNGANKLLRFFSHCLDAYFFDLSIDDFGFDSFSAETDDTGLDQLNAYIQNHGTVNSGGAYEITAYNTVSGGSAQYYLTYTPATGTTPSSTVADIYFEKDNVLYVISVTLNPADEGNRFELLYAAYNGQNYQILNLAWGYLDARFLTSQSEWECYDFQGEDSYQDALLLDATVIFSHLAGWLNSTMQNVNPSLSLADLGFCFYFN